MDGNGSPASWVTIQTLQLKSRPPTLELAERGSAFRLNWLLLRLCFMRGDERVQDKIFSRVTLEQRVPPDHPLREIRKLTDAVLVSLNDEFDALYAASGRPSIAPEYVLRALLLQGVLFSPRSGS